MWKWHRKVKLKVQKKLFCVINSWAKKWINKLQHYIKIRSVEGFPYNSLFFYGNWSLCAKDTNKSFLLLQDIICFDIVFPWHLCADENAPFAYHFLLLGFPLKESKCECRKCSLSDSWHLNFLLFSNKRWTIVA